jgi:hypothetical protein
MTTPTPLRTQVRRPRSAAPVLLGALVAALLAGLAASAGPASSAAPTAAASPSPPVPVPVPVPSVLPSVPSVLPSVLPSVPVPSVVPSVPVPLNPDDPAPAAPAGPSGQVRDGGGEADSGFFDVGGKIRKAINDWFGSLVTSAASGVLDALGRTVLVTPDPSTNPRVRDLWSSAAVISNTCFVLLVVVGGLLAMGHETVQTRTAAKDVLPRLVVGFVAANTSLPIVGQAVRFANAVSRAFTGQGAQAGAGLTFSQLIVVPVAGDSIFLVLLGLVVLVLAVVLLLTCIGRAAVIVVLSVGGPLMLAFHALPQTDRIANLWWRALAAALGVQVAQAFTLVTAVRVFLVSDGDPAAGLSAGGRLVDILVVICLLWVCIRIPTWARHLVFTGARRSLVGTVIRTLILAKAVGLARGALAGRAGRGPGQPGGGLRVGGRPGGPGGPRPAQPGGPRGPRPTGPSGGGRGGTGPATAGDRSPRRPRPTPRTGSGAVDPARDDWRPVRTSTTSARASARAPARRSSRDPGWSDAAPARLTTTAAAAAGRAASSSRSPARAAAVGRRAAATDATPPASRASGPHRQAVPVRAPRTAPGPAPSPGRAPGPGRVPRPAPAPAGQATESTPAPGPTAVGRSSSPATASQPAAARPPAGRPAGLRPARAGGSSRPSAGVVSPLPAARAAPTRPASPPQDPGGPARPPAPSPARHRPPTRMSSTPVNPAPGIPAPGTPAPDIPAPGIPAPGAPIRDSRRADGSSPPRRRPRTSPDRRSPR